MKTKGTARKAPKRSFKAFREARFGMFIHWGLYSLLGRHEWAMCYERIPKEEYRKLARRFNPRKLKMSNWVRLAQAAGMRYMCLTTRHHDGFAMFDTRASDFNSMNTPARRDFVRDYVDACRKAGMGIGLYYSVLDWGDPGFVAGPLKDPQGWKRFVKVAHTQLLELMSNYGKIDYLFYDGCPPPETWGCADLNAEIRRLQPQMLISSRCGLDEDVESAESHMLSRDPGKMWECCMTSNTSWGYNRGDRDWKTPREVAGLLFRAAHSGGNFLLNVGPKGDGSIPARADRLFRGVGKWLRRNGEAIYGTDPHPFDYHTKKICTARGNTAYVALFWYHGPKAVVAGVANKVKSVRILDTGRRVAFEQEGCRVFLTGLPKKQPDPVLTIIALDLAGKLRGVPHPLLVKEGKHEYLYEKS